METIYLVKVYSWRFDGELINMHTLDAYTDFDEGCKAVKMTVGRLGDAGDTVKWEAPTMVRIYHEGRRAFSVHLTNVNLHE